MIGAATPGVVGELRAVIVNAFTGYELNNAAATVQARRLELTPDELAELQRFYAVQCMNRYPACNPEKPGGRRRH